MNAVKKAVAVVLCPACQGFDEQRKTGKGGHVASFTVRGVRHFAPDIWLAGRSTRIAAEEGLNGIDAYLQACLQFAFVCGIEAQRS